MFQMNGTLPGINQMISKINGRRTTVSNPYTFVTPMLKRAHVFLILATAVSRASAGNFILQAGSQCTLSTNDDCLHVRVNRS